MWGYYFSFFGKLRVYVFLPLFHQIHLESKNEERNKTLQKEGRLYTISQPLRKSNFPEFQPLDHPIILAACWENIGFHIGHLNCRFDLWFVGHDIWTEAVVWVNSSSFCFSIVDYCG